MSERRLAVYLAVLGLLTVLVVMTAYLGKHYSGQNAARNSWVTQNELLLASLPVYPGAVEKSAPYSTDKPDTSAGTLYETGNTGKSYWTYGSFQLPALARSDEILGFYAQQLTGWSRVTLQESGCEVAYRRDRAALSVDACNGALQLVVNYQAYGG
ncbi:MAG: hypothetical protein ABSC36_01530 [Gaiellaceae bacterium]